MLINKNNLHVSEVANYIGTSTRNIYKLIHSKILPAYKVDNSNSWHIPEEAVCAYVAKCIQDTIISNLYKKELDNPSSLKKLLNIVYSD